MAQEAASFCWSSRRWVSPCWVVLVFFLSTQWLGADQVEMRNGERYVGKVVSLSVDTLVVQSEGLGTLRLPRSQVALVTLGPNTATNLPWPAVQMNSQPHPPAVALTNTTADLSGLLQGLGTMTNLIQQVQTQFLSDASPEAKDKFNELVGGLLSGKLTVNDITAQAKSAADQLRAARREAGDDAGLAMDGYLAILDHFLKQTPPATSSATNFPAPSAQKE